MRLELEQTFPDKQDKTSQKVAITGMSHTHVVLFIPIKKTGNLIISS